jgi:hypothetical protein
MKITFASPRLSATIENWPSGGKRVTAQFLVESHPKKGERVSRTTTGKPKCTTYGRRMCIVDGSDGRTYLLQESSSYGLAFSPDVVRIVSSDCQHDASQEIDRSSSYFWHPDTAFSASNEDKRTFLELVRLLDVAHQPVVQEAV